MNIKVTLKLHKSGGRTVFKLFSLMTFSQIMQFINVGVKSTFDDRS